MELTRWEKTSGRKKNTIGIADLSYKFPWKLHFNHTHKYIESRYIFHSFALVPFFFLCHELFFVVVVCSSVCFLIPSISIVRYWVHIVRTLNKTVSFFVPALLESKAYSKQWMVKLRVSEFQNGGAKTQAHQTRKHELKFIVKSKRLQCFQRKQCELAINSGVVITNAFQMHNFQLRDEQTWKMRVKERKRQKTTHTIQATQNKHNINLFAIVYAVRCIVVFSFLICSLFKQRGEVFSSIFLFCWIQNHFHAHRRKNEYENSIR